MHADVRRLAVGVLRESAVLAIAGLGAVVFLYHEALYLRPDYVAPPFAVAAWLVATTVLYLLLRLGLLVVAVVQPRARPDYILCPECGRALDDASPEGVERHRRIAITPRPTEKEILAAVMLRKAIDDARRVATRDLAHAADLRAIPGDVENPPVSAAEFERILRDLDGVRGTRRASDRRPKGPSRPRE